jgi:hypothetical protein
MRQFKDKICVITGAWQRHWRGLRARNGSAGGRDYRH